jgi:hypothetical protein
MSVIEAEPVDLTEEDVVIGKDYSSVFFRSVQSVVEERRKQLYRQYGFTTAHNPTEFNCELGNGIPAHKLKRHHYALFNGRVIYNAADRKFIGDDLVPVSLGRCSGKIFDTIAASGKVPIMPEGYEDRPPALRANISQIRSRAKDILETLNVNGRNGFIVAVNGLYVLSDLALEGYECKEGNYVPPEQIDIFCDYE